MKKVSIIIPNFNGLSLLKENLGKVVKLKKINQTVQEIILVDDGSTDGSISFVKNHYPEIKIIAKKVNSGFAKTVNIGVSQAKGDFVLLLNTDVVPVGNIIPLLLKYFSDPAVFAVGCLDKSIEGDLVVKRGRGIGWFAGGFLIHKKGEIIDHNTLWVSAGSGMFNKSIWQKLGGLDELFSPFYWEDIDISYRALKAGYRIYFATEAEVLHQHHKGVILNRFDKKQIQKISFRNQIIFVWKNISDWRFLLSHLVFLPYYLLSFLIKRKWFLLIAFWEALLKLPKVLKKRFWQKKMWLKTDRQVLEIFAYEWYKK